MLKVPPLVARQSGANVLKTTLSRYQKEREDLVLPEIPRWDLVVVLHESREERARLSAEEVEKLVSFRPPDRIFWIGFQRRANVCGA